MSKQVVEMQTITPSMAEELLKLNVGNRKIRGPHVRYLKEEIMNGRWQANGSTIVFNEDRLLDGQHRLLAIIAAKKPIQSLVVRGVDSAHFDTIDIGKNRTAQDVLGMQGERLVYRLAPTISAILRYRAGAMLKSEKMSNTKVVQFLHDNPSVRESIELCNDVRIMSVPAASACHFLMKKKDAEMANEFVEGIKNGFERADNDPFYDFRKRMLEDFKSRKAGHPSLMWRYQMAFMICAWNDQRKNKKITKPVTLGFGNPESKGKEYFPEII